MFKGKKILIGITGSIAAYKSILLVRLLTKEGAEVKVILTPSAKDFVTPLTLSTLSKQPVLDELFNQHSWSNHVMLGRWADIMLIAPLSCNTLGKMANGLCDNLLLATYLSATCPVVVAPAMDEDMWKHPSTRRNISLIESYGNKVLPVGDGALASGLTGPGRMAEPEFIINYLKDFFFDKPLKGKKAFVTAGPTYEAIDPVRFVGNHSSGKMGIELSKELERRGVEVTLIIGPTTETTPANVKVISVTSAAEMYDACEPLFSEMDIMIMAAAVSDFTPKETAIQKIKKKDEGLRLELVKTKDILKTAGKVKTKKQFLVGFALETNDEKENALKKLQDKNADMIVLNSLKDDEAGFKKDTNKVTIFTSNGESVEYESKSKKDVAKDIVDMIIKSIHE
ncbi:MAG: bifunctional phosphopantothenoylcysteine decarboxylase/phosphopantothenate--cysteine ligase CoaBC [Ginsengibacter sp.]